MKVRRKKCTKTLLSVLLCMAMLVAMLPTAVFASGTLVTSINGELGTPKLTIDISSKTPETSIDTSRGAGKWYADNGVASGKRLASDVTTSAAHYAYDNPDAADKEIVVELAPLSLPTDAAYNGIAWTTAQATTETFFVNYLDVTFMLPDNANVETYLFSYDMNGNYAGAYRKVPGIKIKDGYIYTYKETTATGKDDGTAVTTIAYNETAVNSEKLSANTWYRVIRILDSSTYDMQKEKFVFLKEGTANSGVFDTIVAESMDEYTQCGTSNKSGRYGIFSLGFEASYPSGYTGRGTLIKDFAIYNDISGASAEVTFSDMNRMLSYNASATDLASAAPIGDKEYNASWYESSREYVTFTLPSTDEGNVLKFFRDNYIKSSGKKHLTPTKNGGTMLATEGDSFAVSVEGGKVYANVYNSASTYTSTECNADSTYYNTITKLVEVSTGVYYNKVELSGVTLLPDTKYTILLDRYDVHTSGSKNVVKVFEGTYTGTDADKLLGSYGDAEGQSYVLPTITTDAGATDRGYVTYFAGYGYEKPISIHSIQKNYWVKANFTTFRKGLDEQKTYGVRDNWLTGNRYAYPNDKVTTANVISVGDDWNDFYGYKYYSSDTAPGTLQGPIDVPAGAATIDIDGFLLTPTPGDFIIEYSGDLRDIADVDDLIQLTTTAGTAVDGYTINRDGSTFTLSFIEPLVYGTEYMLTLTDAGKTSYFGFPTVAQTFTFTLEDNLKVLSAALVDGTSGEAVVNLTDSETVKAKVILSNEMNIDRDYLVVVALYGNNAIADLRFVSGTIAAGNSDLEISTEALAVGDATSAKVLVWDNWTNIAPKIAAVEK